ncbi:MAG: hypothetical protein Q7K44_00555 [Candidatus Liptonbacteria bacterium]|nr:hypothetical protein [Candidatus Liptonbacteria bacterium]
MMTGIFMHKLQPYLIGLTIFVGITILVLPFSVSASLRNILLIAAVVALVVMTGGAGIPIGAVEVGAETASLLINSGLVADATFVGVNAAGAGIYAVGVSVSPLSFLTFGAGVAGVAGQSSNAQQTTPNEGATCYGPINSCGQPYQGTWTYTYDDDGNVTSQVCTLPGGDNSATPPESGCPARPSPVSGGWSDWSACSVTACSSAGTQTRSCTNPAPANGGADCSGPSSQSCSTPTCPPPIVSNFSLSPSAVARGNSSVLSWNVSGNVSSCSIDNGVGSVSANGSSPVSPSQTTTYTLSCSGPGGSTSDKTTLTVYQPPSINSFSGSPSPIKRGNSSTLSWGALNADSCSIDNGVGSVNPNSGSTAVSPSWTTTYTLSCSGPGGSTSGQTTLTVNQPPSCVFSAAPSTIVPPQSSSLSWNCGLADSCSIDKGIGSVGASGSRTVKPSQSTTYTLSCDGNGGNASFQTTLRVTNFDIKEVSP